MSLFGSLYTSVSGLNAAAQGLSIISNNIANSATVGYKSSSVSFASLVASAGDSSQMSPGGVAVDVTQNINQQGLLQQTQSPTDLAITGGGFFVVQPTLTPGQGTVYTRAGSFSQNAQGYLTNSGGLYLMGWPLSATGALPAATSSLQSLQAVNLNTIPVALTPTANASISLNLNAADAPAVAPATNYSTSLEVYDYLGSRQTLNFTYTKTANNDWTLNVTGGNPVSTITQALTFNPDGSLATPTPPTLAITGINWGDGSSASQTINLDLSKTTQDAAPYSVISSTQDGQPYGTVSGVAVSNTGIVSATYSNGQTRPIFQIPLATFPADGQLSAQSGDVYAATADSGSANLNVPGTGTAGTISSSSLEQSNVDLATEFSNMIATQQTYSANSKVITAVNQMLQDLLQVQM